MKKAKIYSVLSNSDNETTTIEALADYDEKNRVIKYTEEDTFVEIEIKNKSVTMKRKNEEFNMILKFSLNEKERCKYEVVSLGLNMDIDVYTKKLEIEENRIYINYKLYNDNKVFGVFEYKLLLMEWFYEYKRRYKKNNRKSIKNS